MQDLLTVTGIILKAEPIGEYDRRVVILTKERGKISAFAKGARKQSSRLLAPTSPFCFGEFRLYVGRSSYTLSEASISNYFEELRTDFEGAYFGMYFLEASDFCTRENNDETEQLKLLYQSLRALTIKSIPRKLVRYIFEIKSVVIGGVFPGLPENSIWDESTLYTVSYIADARIEKLYTFTVNETVLQELRVLSDKYCKHYFDTKFKSLEILEMLP